MQNIIELFSHDGLGPPLQGSYDPWLVALSVLVASLASLAALSVASRVGGATGWRSRWAWSGAGALSMGGGVWAMHFVGMLAFSLPCGVTYDVTGTLASMLPSIFASAVALRVVGIIDAIGIARKILAAVLIGAGIGSMHYAGMAAMQPDAIVRYSFGLFLLSVVVAVVLAFAALQVFAVLRRRLESEFCASCFAAPIMGLAIAGMHYTAMQASSFYPIDFVDDFGAGYSPTSSFALLVGGGSTLIGIIAVIASVAGRQWQLSNSLADEVARRQVLEKETEARRARLQAILDAVADAIVTIDRDGRILQWSAGAERIFGYLPDEIVGRCLTRLMPEPHRSSHPQYVDAFLNTGVAKIIGKGRELTGLRKDGSEFPLELTVSQVEDSDEVFFTGILRDITERKAAEAALVTAREEAEAANLAKSQFLATMSHEIRTPMNGVLGMASLLESTPLNSRQRRLLGNVSRSGMALLGIINNILDLAKIEAGKFELSPTVFHLREVIDDLCDLFAERCEQKGVELNCFVDEHLPLEIVGDPTRLRQILTNLVGNAVKFTEKGEILIDLSLQEERDDELTFVCKVKDTGIGIAPDDVGAVFKTFHQVDGSLTRSRGGTGLGLSITKVLVELMGGQISVTSESGVGSTFTFSATVGAVSPGRALVRPVIGQWNGMRLLLADRNPESARILQSYLESWGVVVTTADDLTVARSQFAGMISDHPENTAVVVDAKGYGDAAIAFADWCRTVDPRASVIALTSLDRYAVDDALAERDFAAILPKPVSASDLFNALAPMVTGAGARKRQGDDASAESARMFAGRVLIVEDNLVNQEVSIGMLENFGCAWDAAADGRQALQLAAEQHFDAILMDCEMPIMDGLEAARRIREIEAAGGTAARRVPIIALTAHALTEIRDECLAVGMDDFLTKPFSEQQLAQALARWMPPATMLAPEASRGGSAEVDDVQSPTNDADILDVETIRQLRNRDKLGMPSRFAKLVERFAEIGPELLDEIVSSAAEGDPERLWRAAHSLKSSSGALGALKLAERCAAIEAAARAGRIEEATELCDGLERDVAAVIDALRGVPALSPAA